MAAQANNPADLKARTKNWMLTIWRNAESMEYPEFLERINHLTTVITKGKTRNILYTVGKEEVCPDTKRDHIHALIILDEAIDGKTFKNFCGDPTLHLERQMGTNTEAIEYVQKLETTKANGIKWEVGDKCAGDSKQGKRTDLDSMFVMIKEGCSKKRLYEENFQTMVRYGRGIERAMQILQAQSNRFVPKSVWIIWGKAGVGKTRYARTVVMKDKTFVEPAKNNAGYLSFENITGDEDFILLDEFTGGSQISIDLLKQITDGYDVIMPGRGFSVLSKHSGVVILSNSDPSTWYPSAAPVHYQALWRRVLHCYQCDTDVWRWAHPSRIGANLPAPQWNESGDLIGQPMAADPPHGGMPMLPPAPAPAANHAFQP